MTLNQVLGFLLIVTVCPILGGLPLIAWITRVLTRHNLAQVGTGNISVSAAFYHGGNLVGVLAVLSEAGKGIAAVLLARHFFPSESAWELIALIMLVLGRYWIGKGAGTTNVTWGVLCHDPILALLVFLIGGISFTIFRNPKQGKLVILVLFPVILALLHPQDFSRIVIATILSLLLAWIYQKIPDDLDLPSGETQAESKKVFHFFQGDSAVISLDTKLDPKKVGQKAATLSQLKRSGYSVPVGWVLPPGDDPEPLIKYLPVSESEPLVVRSSAIGEDSAQASAAGQYQSILQVTSSAALLDAINRVLESYRNPVAAQYRRDQQLPDTAMAVLIQKQVKGVFSGVAFSRDPISQQGEAVVVEALPGYATQVVSGKVTPEQYQVYFQKSGQQEDSAESLASSRIEGSGDVPPALIKQVALLARRLEDYYQGLPQDIEWSYDGQKLWLLQARPITTLQPTWTRKIAAEVIPGVIRPLTWSINRPLTCGVWGEIFTIVLGKRAKGMDFTETATLHYSHAYFNVTLLGEIFRRMGLPPESLEFLTRGAKFSKPPINTTIKNVPGLLRLLGREWRLDQDFEADYQTHFLPLLNQLSARTHSELSPVQLLERIDSILTVLKRATYYSILAPLSMSLRQAVLKIDDKELDNSKTPEVDSMRALARIAADARHLLSHEQIIYDSGASLFATLAEIPDGSSILEQFDRFLERYGYLSEVATDVAIPRWQEDPRAVRKLFAQFLAYPLPQSPKPRGQRWKAEVVQARLDLKGRVTQVYSKLMAHLRWSFLAIEARWLLSGLLVEPGDIFFLELAEIRSLVGSDNQELRQQLPEIVQQRRTKLAQDAELTSVPFLVYGNNPPLPAEPKSLAGSEQGLLQGIGASSGLVEGLVKVVKTLQSDITIDQQTIVVVPYTDSGWAPLLARAGGLISEVGGRLSHGAIVAREYGIPAVMDINHATDILRDGQRVRIDGQLGTVEVLE